jgi:hypothetical protein
LISQIAHAIAKASYTEMFVFWISKIFAEKTELLTIKITIKKKMCFSKI